MSSRSRTPRTKRPLTQNPVAVKQARLAAGLKQRELADRVGISPGFLSEIESGERGVSDQTLQRLAKVLAIPVAMLERHKPHKCSRCSHRFDSPADGRIPLHRVRSTGHWCPRGGQPVRTLTLRSAA